MSSHRIAKECSKSELEVFIKLSKRIHIYVPSLDSDIKIGKSALLEAMANMTKVNIGYYPTSGMLFIHSSV